MLPKACRVAICCGMPALASTSSRTWPRSDSSPCPRRSTRRVAAIALAEWLVADSVGVIHLHGLDALCRDRLALLQRVRATPWVVTLHDLTFVNPNAFAMRTVEPDLAWIAEIADTLAHAATVIVPSEYIGELAQWHFPNVHCEVVRAWYRTLRGKALPRAFLPSSPRNALRHVVAVIGAIGPHKGSALLDALVDRLTGNRYRHRGHRLHRFAVVARLAGAGSLLRARPVRRRRVAGTHRRVRRRRRAVPESSAREFQLHAFRGLGRRDSGHRARRRSARRARLPAPGRLDIAGPSSPHRMPHNCCNDSSLRRARRSALA